MTDARTFAIEAHGGQQYGTQPYIVHLDTTVNILREFGFTDQTLIDAAYLHDVIEDTLTGYSALVRSFGKEVADIVFGVTDEPGVNRAERHRKTYPKTASNLNFITVKLADRIANMRASRTLRIDLWRMYVKEYPEFRQALYVPRSLVHMDMWRELDTLYVG